MDSTATEVRIPVAGVELAGTLTIPRTDGPPAAALLLSGSGPLDRDSDHRKLPLGVTRLLAEHLAARGVATLRYDKRGTGESGGDFLSTGLSETVTDARAALDVLRSDARIDAERVFVIGHSEGAFVATALAAEDKDLAGVVLLSGAARTGADVLRWQTRAVLPTLPSPARGVLRGLRALGLDPLRLHERQLKRMARTSGDAERVGLVRVNARWWREFMVFDPQPLLARIQVPVLAVTGDKDLQTPPEDAARAAALVPAGDTTTTASVVADMNHILRVEPGAPSLRAYKKQVREPLHPELLALLDRWLATVAARAG